MPLAFTQGTFLCKENLSYDTKQLQPAHHQLLSLLLKNPVILMIQVKRGISWSHCIRNVVICTFKANCHIDFFSTFIPTIQALRIDTFHPCSSEGWLLTDPILHGSIRHHTNGWAVWSCACVYARTHIKHTTGQRWTYRISIPPNPIVKCNQSVLIIRYFTVKAFITPTLWVFR